MNFGFSRGNEALRQIVRQKTVPYDLTRKSDDNNGRFGEENAAETTVTDVPLYLHNETESSIDTQYGDRLEGDLSGLALPNADVQHDDELTHNGERYVVAQKPELVKDGVLKAFVLNKVVNDS